MALAICTNFTFASSHCNTSSIIVCSSPNSTFPTCNNTHGCVANQHCNSTVYADCTISASNEYTFSKDLFANQSSLCATRQPTVTLAQNLTIKTTNLVVSSTATGSNVTSYNGTVLGAVGSLWAHDGTNVSGANVIGPYFSGTDVGTFPLNCGYLACKPENISVTNTTTCNYLNPSDPPGKCFGDYTNCIQTVQNRTFCVDEDCDWLHSNYTQLNTSATTQLFHFPDKLCRPDEVCFQETKETIFPLQNECLCYQGYILSPADNRTCVLNITKAQICADSNQFRNLHTFECVDITKCETETLVKAGNFSDAVCAEPDICVGVVDSGGICVSTRSNCLSIEYISGSQPDGSPKCETISPPCGKHQIEVSPPTPVSDRKCRSLGSDNMVVATVVIMVPTLVYLLIDIYFRTKHGTSKGLYD